MIKIANYIYILVLIITSNIIVFTLWNHQSELSDSLKLKWNKEDLFLVNLKV